jgi:hypothetical protein
MARRAAPRPLPRGFRPGERFGSGPLAPVPVPGNLRVNITPPFYATRFMIHIWILINRVSRLEPTGSHMPPPHTAADRIGIPDSSDGLCGIRAPDP